ncbi:MAG: glycine zipper 2TM domain-containing protein [Hyphomonadaceae bacterium]
MRGQVLATAALAAMMAFAQPAAAQNYPSYHDEHVATQQQCERARNSNTATGAVLGGLLGAVLGSQASARGHRTDGSVLGGVVGAAAGGAIGRSNTRCAQVEGRYDPYSGRAQQDPYASQDPYNQGYGQDRYGQDRYGRSDDSGLEGGRYRQSGYRDDRRDCRMGQQILRDPYGREYREDVMMCRGNDGVWRPDYR